MVLPSRLVASFFTSTLKNIGDCLRDLKRQEPLADLKHVFLVGGFSSSPLVQAVARTELEGGGCDVLLAKRPGVAIVGPSCSPTTPRRSAPARPACLTA